jgi:tRNA(fMet)-specific endonuclease VapC
VTFLLDTNIVTYIFKRNLNTNNRLREATRSGEEVFISCITYYEVKRGLISINAVRQLADFTQLCTDYEVLFLDDIKIIEKACEIHADLKRKGTPIQDADVLIASTAIIRGLILVTNDRHMPRVENLTVENSL